MIPRIGEIYVLDVELPNILLCMNGKKCKLVRVWNGGPGYEHVRLYEVEFLESCSQSCQNCDFGFNDWYHKLKLMRQVRHPINGFIFQGHAAHQGHVKKGDRTCVLRSCLNSLDPTNSIKHLVETYEFYPTPDEAVGILLEKEKFVGNIWEPACGDGSIVESLCRRGYARDTILASDVHDYGFPGTFVADFFESNNVVDNIITGPPYTMKDEFVEHAIRLATKKVAMLFSAQSLSAIKRIGGLWHNAKHYPVGKITYHENTSSQVKISSFWCVWDKDNEN